MTQDIEKVLGEVAKDVGMHILFKKGVVKFPKARQALTTTLTKVAEEARRECEIELRTKYIVVSKDVQAQHEQQIIEEARKEERERILNMIPSERRMVHHVIATGSQEDLNDTFRRGYNKCRNQVLEVLSDNK